MFSKTLKFSLMSLILLVPAWAHSAPLKVAVSILPQKYFVDQIGKDNVDVSVIVPPGASPATYSPTVQQMTDLSSTKTYFTMGVPFEKAWLPRLSDVNVDLNVVPLYERICLRKWPSSIAEKDTEAAKEADTCRPEKYDPHSWMSPPMVRVMAGTIRDTLVAADPDHADSYYKNYRAFVGEIDDADKAVVEALGDKALGKSFMVYHPAFGYFARAYGLKQIAIEIKGTEPTPAQLAKIVAEAKTMHSKIIFVQPQFSQQAAKTIAKEIGGSVIPVNPLAPNWTENIVSIAKGFAKALQ